MNPMDIMRLKDKFDTFQNDHPKVIPFFRYIGDHAMTEGTILELKCTTTDGRESVSNIRITQNDIDLMRELMSMGMR